MLRVTIVIDHRTLYSRWALKMKRHLIHEMNHTILVVDATPIGLPTEIYPVRGKEQPLSSFRFQSWQDAESFLLGMGAKSELLHQTRDSLKATSLAVLTILAPATS